jgi:hypothetical protein
MHLEPLIQHLADRRFLHWQKKGSAREAVINYPPLNSPYITATLVPPEACRFCPKDVIP